MSIRSRNRRSFTSDDLTRLLTGRWPEPEGLAAQFELGKVGGWSPAVLARVNFPDALVDGSASPAIREAASLRTSPRARRLAAVLLAEGPMADVSDRRQWAPQAFAAPVLAGIPAVDVPAVVRPRVRTRSVPVPGSSLSPRLRFVNPDLVLDCVRRRARRQVLFAFKRTNGRARKRRGPSSDIGC